MSYSKGIFKVGVLWTPFTKVSTRNKYAPPNGGSTTESIEMGRSQYPTPF
jgi:hypothetical protein